MADILVGVKLIDERRETIPCRAGCLSIAGSAIEPVFGSTGIRGLPERGLPDIRLRGLEPATTTCSSAVERASGLP
jgi:hypothetical protein